MVSLHSTRTLTETRSLKAHGVKCPEWNSQEGQGQEPSTDFWEKPGWQASWLTGRWFLGCLKWDNSSGELQAQHPSCKTVNSWRPTWLFCKEKKILFLLWQDKSWDLKITQTQTVMCVDLCQRKVWIFTTWIICTDKSWSDQQAFNTREMNP